MPKTKRQTETRKLNADTKRISDLSRRDLEFKWMRCYIREGHCLVSLVILLKKQIFHERIKNYMKSYNLK